MHELITVIIPAYNAQETLPNCLDSVLSQSYQNIEVIVVDDGSFDKTNIILEEYTLKDNRVKVFFKENGGQSSARNLALSKMSGKFFTFVDSDDMIEPDMIMTLYKKIKDCCVDISICGLKYTHGNVNCNKYCENKMIMGRENVLKTFLTEKTSFGPVCKLFPSSLYAEVKFVEGIIFEDVEYLTRIFLKTDSIVLCDYPGYIFNVREGSTTHSDFNEKYFNILEVTDLIIGNVNASQLSCKNELESLVLNHYLTFINFVVKANKQQELKEKIMPLIHWIRLHFIHILFNTCISIKRKLFAIIITINIRIINKLFVALKSKR